MLYLLILCLLLFIIFQGLFLHRKNKPKNTLPLLDSIPLSCSLINREFLCFDCNEDTLKLYQLKTKAEYINNFYNLTPAFQDDGRPSKETYIMYVKKAFETGMMVFEWTDCLLDGTPIPLIITLIRVNYENDYVIMSYARDISENKRMTAMVEQRNNYLSTVNSVSAILLGPNVDEFDKNILYSMSLIANATDVDRIHIWKNHVVNDNLYFKRIYIWPEDTAADENYLKFDFQYSNGFNSLENSLSRGESINSLVKNRPEEEQGLFKSMGILSVLIVPVFLQEEFWGFFCFDECRYERVFTKNEDSILRSGSLLIANALLRQGITQNLVETSSQLETALYKAQEASHAKSDFLAKMSHEIRTPMNAIIGMTELALRAEELNTAMEHIMTVKQAGANLLSIINDILDFSKIETGKLEIIPDEYLFSSLAFDVIGIIRMRAVDSRIRFVVNIDSRIPNRLIGDEVRIRQILLNILNNAVKYTEKGFVSFNVYSMKKDESTVNLILEIADSGIGIKEENLKKLFMDYTQFDLAKNRGIEGTGLGLAITHNILKEMGGNISVESEYGKGSTFTVMLPQEIASNETMAAVNNPESKSVIVYERRDIYAKSIMFSLENLKVKCSLVSNDTDLIERMSSKNFSHVFISYFLYLKNRDIINKYDKEYKIIVLTEFGEAIQERGLYSLAMPVHSISIANMLNGISGNFMYNETNELAVRFTSPQAKVLIVDDINTNLKVAEGLLIPYKMIIETSKNGMDAIEKVKKTQYDIIFMDHKMPEMDGVEATIHIRSLGKNDPYYSNVPIIALTANAVAGTKEMFLENGFNDFISKPIDIVKMNSILEKWIPKDKQSNLTTDKPLNTEKQEVNTIQIDEIDTERGIYLSGGSVKSYFSTLEIFVRDSIQKITEIDDCIKNNNYELYTVHVHALKSACANIGAHALSKKALELETAGDNNDIDFIGTNNDIFIQETNFLLNKINMVLNENKTKTNVESENSETADIEHDLEKLKTAIEILDAGEINTIMDNLNEYLLPEHLSKIIQDIGDFILFSEFDRALELINSSLEAFKKTS